MLNKLSLGNVIDIIFLLPSVVTGCEIHQYKNKNEEEHLNFRLLNVLFTGNCFPVVLNSLISPSFLTDSTK